MTWDKAFSAFMLSSSCASLGFLAYTSFRVWQSQKRVLKANREYTEALEKATAHLKANPTAWLDAMQSLDDKRRMH